jgi:hypothetical protein
MYNYQSKKTQQDIDEQYHKESFDAGNDIRYKTHFSLFPFM